MAVQDYKINYKSDFVLTINGDAGWAIPFCIKFWTGMPSQAYFVGFDGLKYVNCRVGDTPTQLQVMFDDHHLPIGPLRMQIAYHTTIEEFPGSVFDEVTNARDVIVTIDGTDYQVMLDFTGEDAPELEFDLPAYANEAERIQNELHRQQNEAARIAAELQREQATAAAVEGAENVNAQLNGTTLTVTNRQGVSTSVNTKGEPGERGPVGPEGPQGEQGQQGIQGPAGPQGIQGTAGPQGETGISIVDFSPKSQTETTLIYTVTFSDGHTQDVAIPKGPKGDTGATGPVGPQGQQGETGVSITGFVETGETETSTLYTITFSNGTTQPVAIPKGEKGDQGPVGPVGPQGPMGDVAVITPEQQAAFTMYSTTGQNTDGPMTQKAVTDALVASAISYDNSQSGLAATNVQGALDEVVEELISYTPVYDDDKFSFSTTSSAKSAYYLRAIPFVQGGIYRLTFTLDDVKENKVDLYLANSSNKSATGLARIIIGAIEAGSNTKTIDYTCNDATMLYPSINCAAATSGSLSILVEKQVYISTEINDVQESVKSLYITKDVEVNASDGFEIAGYNISPTTWKSDKKRKIQRISVNDCDSVTITALSTEGRSAAYSFITNGAWGTGAPVYYCKGYTGWVIVPYGETVTVDVPELAKFIIIYKDYGGTVFFPAKLVFHKRVNPTEEISGAIDFAENAVDKRIDGAGYSVGSYTIDNASPSKWSDSVVGAKSRIVPLKAGRYTLRADNGIGIYAILKSANRIHGEVPDWADDFIGRLRLNYGQSTTIELSSDSYLWCRHDSEAPSPAGNEMLTIIPEVSNSEFLQEQLASHNKPLSTIIVAASDSTSYDKARADIVCTGTDDNKSIETAISMIGGVKGTVYLCRGTYYVTSFTEDTDGTFVGIRIPGKDSSLKMVNIEGYHWGGAVNHDVKIVVNQTTYDSLDSSKNYSVIRHAYVSNGYNLNYKLALRHIGFTVYSNQKKITVIDCSCTSQINMEDVSGGVSTQAGVWGNAEQQAAFTPASIDCVFFRGLVASGNGWDTLKDCYCSCYGIGFGIQGEHMIAETCAAINCIYGFAFNYFPNIGSSTGMYVHPMIIINPVEEGCFNYPYFGDNPQKQSINIIGYHNEHRPFFFSPDINGGGNIGGNYATEKVPGQWYGHVDYAIQNFPDSHSHGSEMHAVEIPFWADGSGVNMESVNMVHKRIATSAVRRGYAPNYAQQIFDTTANKLLICTDPANKTWVDVNGNVVQ